MFDDAVIGLEAYHNLLEGIRILLAIITALTISLQARILARRSAGNAKFAKLVIVLCCHILVYYTTSEFVRHFVVVESSFYITIFTNWSLALRFHGVLTLFVMSVIQVLERKHLINLINRLRLRYGK